MATIIVNPTASSDGTGSLISPRNVWPSSFSPGDEVLQVADTVWTGDNGNALYNIYVNDSGTAAAPIVLGVCEPQTGVRITDGSRKARIDGTGRQIGARTAGGINWVTFDGLEVFDVTGTGSTRAWGIYLGSAESSVSNNCKILNCHIHDISETGFGDDDGIQVFGSDCLISNVRIHDVADDGIWLQGMRAVIENCTISRIGTGPNVTGDGIQVFGTTTLGCGGVVVRNNYVDHENVEEKQCLIVQGHTDTSVGAEIYGNVFKHYRNPTSLIIALYVEMLNARIWGNVVSGGYYGVLSGVTAFGDGDNMIVTGNVITDALYGLLQGANNTGAKFYNNVVANCSVYGIYADTDTSFVAQNNILLNNAIGMGHENGATENYNCFYGNGTNKNSLGGGAIPLGAQSITSDPLLGPGYRLLEDSPCIGAGTQISGLILRDFDGKHWDGAVDIGARQYHAQRAKVDGRSIAAGRTASLGRTRATNR